MRLTFRDEHQPRETMVQLPTRVESEPDHNSNREGLGIEVDLSRTAERVIRFRDQMSEC